MKNLIIAITLLVTLTYLCFVVGQALWVPFQWGETARLCFGLIIFLGVIFITVIHYLSSSLKVKPSL